MNCTRRIAVNAVTCLVGLGVNSCFAAFVATNNNNITLANSQVESGGDTSLNPNVVNGSVGTLINYTAASSAGDLGGAFTLTNLNDGDIGATASDGTYAIPNQNNTLTLAFAGTTTVGSIAIYNGYANRDDGSYELRDGSNNLLGSWDITATIGSTNANVDSFWLTFISPVSTDELRVIVGAIELGTASFREIQVFAPIPEPTSYGMLLLGSAGLLVRRRMAHG